MRIRFFTILTLFLWFGCSKQDAVPAPSLERVVAVKAEAAPVKKASSFCDVQFDEDKAPVLKLPAVEGVRGEAVLAKPPADQWVWLNIWATWCGPCRKEMPLLRSWETQLKKEGLSTALWWLSVDEDKEGLETFLKENPEAAKGVSMRLLDFGELAPWLQSYGVKSAASIPIQILIAPGAKVRCLRVGSVHAQDYGRVKSVMKSSGF